MQTIITMWQQYWQQNGWEWAGVLASLICVWLNTRANAWGWVWGVVASALYLKVFAEARLYGDVALQILFIAMSLYGLYQWIFGVKDARRLYISRIPTRVLAYLVSAFALLVLPLGYGLKYIGSDLAYLDASTTLVSILAQYAMARKYLENWLMWIGVNIAYIGMYLSKELYPTAGLYAIFLFLAYYGYKTWQRIAKEEAVLSNA